MGGHRARLKARFAQHGLDGFHDYEVIEILLMYAIPRKDVKLIVTELENTNERHSIEASFVY